MAGPALLVVGPAVAAETAGRIGFGIDPVARQVIATVHEFPVGTLTVTDRGLYFRLPGMAFIAEGAFVAQGAEPFIPRRVKTVILDECARMVE